MARTLLPLIACIICAVAHVEVVIADVSARKNALRPSPRPELSLSPPGVTQVCSVCEHVYDPSADGDGKSFEDLADDFKCPVCGAPKSAFEVDKTTSTATTTVVSSASSSPLPPPSPSPPRPDEWVCSVCDHVYNSDADGNGEAFEDLPEDFKCPICGAPKSAFEVHTPKSTSTSSPSSTSSSPSPPVADGWVCSVCEHVYNSDADGNGEAFEDLPEDFKCPVCGAPKSAFEPEGPTSDKSAMYTALVWIHRCGVLLSWGLLYPLGVSLVRFHPSGARLRLHRTVQCTGLLVDTFQFICIIWAHQVGPDGQGPVDGNFAGTQGASPTRSHKRIGLLLYICVILQAMLGIFRPKPYPNNLKRRLWLWLHRVIGDGSLIMAWVQIWQGIFTVTEQNAFLSLAIVMGMFMVSSAFVVPIYFMMQQSIRAEEAIQPDDLDSVASILSNDASLVASILAVDGQEEETHPRDAMFYGCGHCTQVFTSQKILEIHTKFIHPDAKYSERCSPMPQRLAEISNIPAVSSGIPLSEVSRHKTKTDCWVVISGKVYDLTAFLGVHPGGPNAILSWAGRDATKTWKLIHQQGWMDRYQDTVICQGSVAPEDPVEGLRPRKN